MTPPEELLPCPFCAKTDWLRIDASVRTLTCSRCFNGSQWFSYERWNTRTPSKAEEENARLIAEKKIAVDCGLKLADERDTLRTSLAQAEQRVRELEKDKARLDWLERERGHFQDGSFTTVKFSGDDATRTWHLDIGKSVSGYGHNIRQAIDAAISAQAEEKR